VDYAVARRVAASTAPSVVLVRTVGADGHVTPVGSGVVVGEHRVMTNAHLLAGAAGVDVVSSDGHPYSAKVAGTDPQTDLALLDMDGGDLPTVYQTEITDTSVGTAVVAVAAKSAGAYRTGIDVISDRNRMIDAGTGITVAGALETGIAPGALWAGGALDSDGNLVGLLTTAQGAPGLGLVAIPVDAVRDVRDQLESSGTVRHAWLGVVFGDDAVERPRGGARIAGVLPGSPAAKGGLEPGDVVTHVGDTVVGGRADAIAAVRALRPQDPVEIGFTDPAGKTHNPRVTLGNADPPAVAGLPGSG
jgi:S1-C subfamily serine protease